MADLQRTHFFTELGALCGAVPPYRWSMSEGRTTCGECRRMLRAGMRNRPAEPPFEPEGAVALGRSRGSR